MRIKYLFGTLTRKNPQSRKDFKNETIVNNVYGHEKVGEQLRRFHFIHYVFKYKIIVPLIIILRWAMGRRLVKRTPDKPQFDMVKQFEIIWDEAVIDWQTIYINSLNKKAGRPVHHREFYKGQYPLHTRGTVFLLRTMKELGVTGMVNDDAYTEFITFFLWRAYLEMSKRVEHGETFHFMRSVPDKMDSVEEIIYLSLQKAKSEGQWEIFKAGRQQK